MLEMFNYQSLLQCLIDQAETSVSEQGESWNQGWNSTNEIFQRHSEVRIHSSFLDFIFVQILQDFSNTMT